MNLSCFTFILSNISLSEVKGKRIIEVGSQNINGSVRPAFEALQPSEYIGVDFQEGKDVDLVCNAADLIEKFGEKSFDIVVSTEMLEHVADWIKIVSNLKRLVRDNGLLFLTTRSKGFAYHGYPYDFWRYEIEDFAEIFSDMNIIKLEKDMQMPGVFLKAIKPDNFSEKDLSQIKLYSIIFNERYRCLSNDETNTEDFKRMLTDKDNINNKKRKMLVIGLGVGHNYLTCLKKLAEYKDFIEISLFDKIPGYEHLFNNFTLIPPLAKMEDIIPILTNVDCFFITPGTPLAVKKNLLDMGFSESKIYTELESVLPYIKMPLALRNIGSMKYNAKSINNNKILLDTNYLNDLETYFLENKNRRPIFRWMHYFEIYERHFAKFRNTDVTIVEIGVFNGGSLQMWKNYFGKKCRVIGIDINPKCQEFAEEQIEIVIGSQEDRNFLRNFAKNFSKIDILIDDGGHTMTQQITTFEELFPLISENGIYLCEDLHTSYWAQYGGRYKKPGTFIEYSKEFIDYINSWHFKELETDMPAQNFKHSAHSLHYYDSILVIEKRKMYPPQSYEN